MSSIDNIQQAIMRIELAVEQENYSSALEIFYREFCNEGVDKLEEELKDLADTS